MSRMLTTLLAALVLAAGIGLGAAAQEGPGAGGDPNVQVPPGLTNVPGNAPARPEEVQLYVPQQDQLVGRVTIPDQSLATLVQPEGRDWRAYRRDLMLWIIGGLFVFTVLVLAIFYLWRGTIRLERGRSGRWVRRFSTMDRFAHWTTALAFIALGLTGLLIAFGRELVLPWLGHDAFTPLANGAKYLHNFSSVPFVIGVVLMLVLWIRDNIPERSDLVWLRTAGGIFSRGRSEHPETGRFNAGQKGIFWSVVLLGMALAVTGYMLMTPFSWVGVSGMQTVHVVHSILAGLMLAIILAHIYIGTLGMEGAFDAMGRGRVDENWAMEHHRGWYERQVRADRDPPAVGHRAGAD